MFAVPSAQAERGGLTATHNKKRESQLLETLLKKVAIASSHKCLQHHRPKLNEGGLTATHNKKRESQLLETLLKKSGNSRLPQMFAITSAQAEQRGLTSPFSTFTFNFTPLIFPFNKKSTSELTEVLFKKWR